MERKPVIYLVGAPSTTTKVSAALGDNVEIIVHNGLPGIIQDFQANQERLSAIIIEGAVDEITSWCETASYVRIMGEMSPVLPIIAIGVTTEELMEAGANYEVVANGPGIAEVLQQALTA